LKDHYFPPVKSESIKIGVDDEVVTGQKRKSKIDASVKIEVDQEVQEFLSLLHELSAKIGIELSIFKGTGKLKGLNRKPIHDLKALLNEFELNTDGDIKDLRLRLDDYVSKKLKQC